MTEQAYSQIVVQQEGGIVVATLNRPEKRNAMTLQMRKELTSLIGDVALDDAVRVLIVTGAGESFCSGADVSVLEERGKAGRPSARRDTVEPLGHPFITGLYQLPKPVIAALNGPLAGAGISLALACDVRIAAETATFHPVWLKRGLVPDWGASYALPRVLGYAQAMELLMASSPVSAQESHRLGLVNRVTPPGKALETALELARSCAALPATALELMKRNFQHGAYSDLQTTLEMETRAQNICFQTEDFQEAMRAFREKREPRFQDR